MSEETKYEFNVYARQLNKDLTNLMDCLRKQDKDNKAILYEGRHLKKVILPYEEYQKMCQRLEAIDKSNPSEALEILLKAKQERLIFWGRLLDNDKIFFETLEPALLKSQEQEKVLKVIKKKKVDIWQLKQCDFERYNFWIRAYYSDFRKELTQEEFDLLKRWLE